MPYTSKRISSGPNKGKVRVTSPHGTKAKAATSANAERQKRLLRGIEHGWKPTGKPAMK